MMSQPAVPAAVLVAEDDPDLRALVEVVLHNAGYRVVPVESGSAALRVLADERPCLMVLDVMMPGIGGLDVCRAVRADRDAPGCAILLMSSHASLEEIAEGHAAGADDYLPKPFTRAELLRRVGLLLQTAA